MQRINVARSFLIGAVMCGMAAGSSAEVVAYWPFGMYGLKDASGNGHTLVKSAAGVVFGNGAVSLDGTQTLFGTALPLDLSGYSNLTVEFWMRFENQSLGMIIEHTENYGSNPGAFLIDVNDGGTTGNVLGGFRTGDGNNLDVTPANVAADGQWHHVAVVYDSSKTGADRSVLYFDGTPQSTFANYASDAWTTFRNAYLYIGSRANNAYQFVGDLDDIRISNAALAPGEFLQARSDSDARVVAYWPFGMYGLDDASGNGHTLVKSAAGVGFDNGAVSLDGTQTQFGTALPLDLSGYGNLTVEFWMRVESQSTGMIIEHTENYALNPGAFLIDVNEGAAGQVISGFRTGGGYNLDATPADAASDGQWHHVAVVVDSSKTGAERSVLYFDGSPQSMYADFANDAWTTFRNAYLYIGSRANQGLNFVGDLDDIRISNAALTPGEFLQARSDSDARVIAYWPFDRGSELADASGRGNTLAGGSGVVFSNGVAVLDGAQAALGTAAALDLSGCTNLTVEFWMRTTDGGPAMLIEHSANATNNPGAFAVSLTGDTLAGGFRMDDGGNDDSTGTGTALTNGSWHHVALVYDEAAVEEDRVRLYVDQVRQTPSDVYTNDVLGAFRNEILYIGAKADNGQPFNGELDDIRIVDAALTTNQFMQAHSDGTPRVIAYWPFGRGHEVADASGHNFTLAMKQAGDVEFKDGSAVFKGRSGLYWPLRFDLSGFKAITAECFVRTASTNQTANLLEISGNYNQVPGTFAVSTGMLNSDEMGAGYKTGDGYNIESAAKGAISDGAWHHVAYVIDLNAVDGAERTRLYLDGVRQSSSSVKSATASPFAYDQLLFVGFRANSDAVQFIGEMDDIRITGAALTTNEFLTLAERTADPVTNAVIAYWPFEASNGLADASGNGNALTGNGVVFSDGTAFFGGAQTCNTASTLDLSPYTAITVEYFIRTSSTDIQIVLEQSENYGSYPGAFAFYQNEPSGVLTVAYKTGVFANLQETSAGAASDGRWHHVGMIIDRSKPNADRVQLYLDYVRQSQRPDYAAADDTSFINGTLFIGSRNNAGIPFVGQLDDIRITGKALTLAEFMTRPTTVLPPVIAYWPFACGRELEDASGNGYSLANSGVSFNAAAGTAVFSGDHAAFNTLEKLDLHVYDALTVECFVKTPQFDKHHMIMETSADAALNQGAFYLFSSMNTGRAESLFTTGLFTLFFGALSNNYNQDRSDGETTLTDGKWHHLALVIDPAKAGADRAVLYLDRAPQPSYSTYESDLATAFLEATLYIGSRANSAFKFSGEMDDVRISGAALTPEQFLRGRSRPQGTLFSLM